MVCVDAWFGVLPVVVDCVEKSAFVCATNLGTAARGVVDVVALESNRVSAANE